MKFIYLANIRLPTEKAHGLQIMKMCEAFAALGHKVKLVVPRRRNLLRDDPFQFYGIAQGFEIKYLPVLDLVGLVPKIGFWLEIVTFFISAKIYLASANYDFLYTRGDPLLSWGRRNAVLELHAFPGRVRFFHVRAWSAAKRIVVLTSFIKARIVEQGIDGKKILIAPDAVNLEEFISELSRSQAQENLGLPVGKILLGYIGMLKTLNMEKGISQILQATKQLPDNFISILIGGHSRDIESYQAEAKNLGIAERVKFVGQMPHAKVPTYLKACDILLAPFPDNEHYRYFMSPLKIFEYMASGRPMVVSDLPSLREVLSEDNCLFCKAGDASDLAEKIAALAADKKLGESLALRALENVRQHTWRGRARKIIESLANE